MQLDVAGRDRIWVQLSHGLPACVIQLAQDETAVSFGGAGEGSKANETLTMVWCSWRNNGIAGGLEVGWIHGDGASDDEARLALAESSEQSRDFGSGNAASCAI